MTPAPAPVPADGAGIDSSATDEHTASMSNNTHPNNTPDLADALKESLAQATPPVQAPDDLPADAPEATTPTSDSPADLFPDAALTQVKPRKVSKTKTSSAPAQKAARSTKRVASKQQIADAPKKAEKVKRTGTPRGQGYATHQWERKSEDKPCLACDSPYVHSKGYCSKCYNAARKPLKQGLKGQALINAVKERRGFALSPADKRRASKERAGASTPATSARKEGSTATA